jgi:hypothetical protein
MCILQVLVKEDEEHATLNFLIGIFCWPWQGKDIAYRFIVEYSSLMDF